MASSPTGRPHKAIQRVASGAFLAILIVSALRVIKNSSSGGPGALITMVVSLACISELLFGMTIPPGIRGSRLTKTRPNALVFTGWASNLRDQLRSEKRLWGCPEPGNVWPTFTVVADEEQIEVWSGVFQYKRSAVIPWSAIERIEPVEEYENFTLNDRIRLSFRGLNIDSISISVGRGSIIGLQAAGRDAVAKVLEELAEIAGPNFYRQGPPAIRP